MLWAVLLIFAAAAVAPWLLRRYGANAGLALAVVPLLSLAMLPPMPDAGGAVVQVMPWIPGLGIEAAFRLDGLSFLMALLILGIGVLILAYSSSYLAGDDRQGRFYAMIMAFMGSMLGLVLAEDVLLLFVFWELTSITSFLLIGYSHEDATARRCAFQGLFVTVAGGLAMLAGLILLGQIAGSYRLGDIIAARDLLLAHEHYHLALGLVAMGCFAKSAQFPFHFWLPNAMAAPTPVSAYLHSATMVKAGVYLLARLHPALGDTELWFWWLAPVGALTLLTGAFMAYRSSGIKRVLAYTTVMALGTLTLLLGLGAPEAAVTVLFAHAMYKGALFLVAGILDHEAGAKDLLQVSGQHEALPLTAAAAGLAALSTAGLPPLFGFVAKEMMLESVLAAPAARVLFALVAVAGAALVTAMAAVVALRPFYGPRRAPREQVHEAPWSMLAGPVLLAAVGIVAGMAPQLAEAWLLGAAAVAAGAPAADLHLALWHGFNLPLLLSGVSLAVGVLLYLAWPRLQPRLAGWRGPEHAGPEHGYELLMSGLTRLAEWQTALLQTGRLRYYVLVTVSVAFTVTATTLALKAPQLVVLPAFGAPPGVAALIAALLLAAAVAAIHQRRTLGAVLALGVAGFCVALVYVWFSAPDVAITQVLVETLTIILLVLVLFRMPRFRRLSSAGERLRDAVVAVSFGLLITVLLWMVLAGREYDSVAAYFIEQSVPGGQGRNIVNVILVDFRALDTLGEIFVLGLAAVGVFALLKIRPRELT